MSRTVSSATLQAMFSQETDKVFVLLVTIAHPDLSPPIRVCSDAKNIVSRTETFVALP